VTTKAIHLCSPGTTVLDEFHHGHYVGTRHQEIRDKSPRPEKAELKVNMKQVPGHQETTVNTGEGVVQGKLVQGVLETAVALYLVRQAIRSVTRNVAPEGWAAVNKFKYTLSPISGCVASCIQHPRPI